MERRSATFLINAPFMRTLMIKVVKLAIAMEANQ